jgi:hypothetical protein
MKIIKMSSVGSYMMTHFLLSLAIQAQAITHTILLQLTTSHRLNDFNYSIVYNCRIKSLLNIKIKNILNY